MSALRKKAKVHTVIETVFLRSSVSYLLNTTAWVALVDGAVIGNFLGVDAVAAYGMVWPLMLVYGLIGGVLSGGTRNLYTRLTGQGKTEEANGIFTLVCVVCILFSAAIIVVSLCFTGWIAGLLGAEGQNAHLSPLICQYIRGFVFEVPFYSLGGILSALMVIDADFMRPAYARIAMSIADIAGDLIVVLFFNGGMFLLGFTTAIAQMVYFLVMCTHFLRKDRMLRLTAMDFSRCLPVTASVFQNGAPAGLTSIASAAGGIAVNRILSFSAASTFLAAYSVHRSMGSLMGAAYMCVADSVWTLSGIYYGEEDRIALDRVQRTALRNGLLLNGGLALVIFAFPHLFARIFINGSSPEALMLSEQAVRFFALSMPLYMLVYAFRSYLMGTRKLKAANLLSIMMECGVLIPAAWIMIRLFGGSGAWFATPVRLLLMILGAFLYVSLWKEGDSFHDRRLLLEKDFGGASGKELAGSAGTIREVVEISQAAMCFCLENGIDRKKANAAALCIEELGNSIIKRGFQDAKPHSLDIRILIREEELILRMRDDCRLFNPLEEYGRWAADEDLTKNIGVRAVMKMCRDIQYLSTAGTNNLIVRL